MFLVLITMLNQAENQEDRDLLTMLIKEGRKRQIYLHELEELNDEKLFEMYQDKFELSPYMKEQEYNYKMKHLNS